MAVSAAGIGLLSSMNQLNGQTVPKMEGFDQTQTDIDSSQVWHSASDRKIRVGIVGYGACKFGAHFGYQDHPNVEVVAVSDLIPDRCAGLARDCRCKKTYPSLKNWSKTIPLKPFLSQPTLPVMLIMF